MWHKLHILVNKIQYAWLKAESFTQGISIGEIMRRLIDEAVGAYTIEHNLPYLDWYCHQGFEGRTTARLTGDAVRQYTLTWLKKHKPDSWNKLTQRFPEFRFYV